MSEVSKQIQSLAKNFSIKPKGNAVTNSLINLGFIFYSLLCILPMVLIISVSFSEEKSLLIEGYKFFPKVFSMEAYKYVLAAGDTIWRAYGNTIFITVVGTTASLIVISLYAYPLSRSNFRYKNFFSFMAFFTMIFGGGLIPWYMVYTHIVPIKNTIWIMIVPYLMNAWYMIIMRTFYKTTIHEAILESARIDGAGEFRTFIQIVLPLSKPGLATVGLFMCLQYWNDWYLAMVFVTNAKLNNIQYLMYKTMVGIQYLLNNSDKFSNAGLAIANLPSESARMAIAVIAVGPIVLAYPFFQRYFIKGLTVGAVKG